MHFCCRAPHGARGLKFPEFDGYAYTNESRPARGARIEILMAEAMSFTPPSRAPHGARGLKLLHGDHMTDLDGRAPHGARGLKSKGQVSGIHGYMSRPARGARIEMCDMLKKKQED